MPSKIRHATQYPGVYFIDGKTLDGNPSVYITYAIGDGECPSTRKLVASIAML